MILLWGEVVDSPFLELLNNSHPFKATKVQCPLSIVQELRREDDLKTVIKFGW